MLLPHHRRIDHHFLPIRVLLEDIEPAYLPPVDGSPIEDVHAGSIDNFDPIGEIRAVYEGCVVPKTGLDVVDSLM